MSKKAKAAALKKRRETKLRAWRKKTRRTLQDVGAEVGISHASLSRIERGHPDQGYTEDLLEDLARIYGATHPVDLLIRDPDDPEGLYSIMDRATPAQRRKIARIAKELIEEG